MDGYFVNRFGKRTKDRFYEAGSLFKTFNIKNLFLFMAIEKNIKKNHVPNALKSVILAKI